MAVSTKIEDFIERSSWIRRMFEEGARLKAEHGAENVYDLSLGNPNLEPPPEFKQLLADLAVDERRGLHGYMPNAGLPEARAAVAAGLSSEHEVQVPPENVVMTVGAGGGLNVVFKAILDPGDEVIVPRPYFVEYDFYVDNHGGSLKTVSAGPDFALDPEAIRAAIGPRTRAVLINSPNNPTGRVYDEVSLLRLGRVLEEAWVSTGRVIYLVADEPYRKIIYEGVSVPPVMPVYANTIVVSSHSKDLSLAGERIGYVGVSPQSNDASRLMAGLILANRILGFVNAPAIAQRAAARLQGITVDLGPYARNRRALWQGLTDLGYEVPMPEGAFYLFPKAPGGDDLAFVKRLQDELVLAVPGRGFGEPGYFRLSYAVPYETVEGALPILARAKEESRG